MDTLGPLLDGLPAEWRRTEESLGVMDKILVHPGDVNLVNCQVYGFLKNCEIFARSIEGQFETPLFSLDVEKGVTFFLELSKQMIQQYGHVYPDPLQFPTQNQIAARDYNRPFILAGELFETMDKFLIQLRAMDAHLLEEWRNRKRATKSLANLAGVSCRLFMPWEVMKSFKHIVLQVRFDRVGHLHDFATFYCFFTFADTAEGAEIDQRVYNIKDGLFHTREPIALRTLSMYFGRSHTGIPLDGRFTTTTEQAQSRWFGNASKKRVTMDVTSREAKDALLHGLNPHTREDVNADRIEKLVQMFERYAIQE